MEELGLRIRVDGQHRKAKKLFGRKTAAKDQITKTIFIKLVGQVLFVFVLVDDLLFVLERERRDLERQNADLIEKDRKSVVRGREVLREPSLRVAVDTDVFDALQEKLKGLYRGPRLLLTRIGL